MKQLFCMLALACALFPATVAALDLSAYQRADGAISVHRRGDHVDPYFVMKALWAARQLGDPAVKETHAWIEWLLPQQGADGGFARYCEREGRWQVCADADADDALLALWIELLHEAAPRKLPPRWADSARRADQALALLKDPNTGVYRATAKISDALLMDNTEICSAFRRVGELRRGAGDAAGATRYLAQAQSLRLAMTTVFRPIENGLLRWSSGDASGEKFYPHRVAHLYPWLHRMDTVAFGPMLDWQGWLNRYGDAWLARADDVYPWGLVALTAYRFKSNKAIERWLDNAPALREGANWNVLEEAVLQGLARARLEGWK